MLGTYYELLKGIKRELDPHNIMNPGRLGMTADPAGL
ncbi:MAG: FAD-linked oxidase C-terminal domain-containing protein [Actinomycetota bacterium]